MRDKWARRSALEVVLIVLGVLIALGIDSFAQGRQDRELAARYLQSLRRDLASDVEVIRVALKLLDGKDAGIHELRQALRGESPGAGRLSLALGWATDPNVTTFNDATYRDLVSTGNLRLLPFDTREALARLYRNYAVLRFYQEDTVHPLRPLRSYFPPDVRDEVVACFVAPECVPGRDSYEATFDDLEPMAADILRRPEASDTTLIHGWTTEPDLQLKLQGELAESRTWRRRLNALSSNVEETRRLLEEAG